VVCGLCHRVFCGASMRKVLLTLMVGVLKGDSSMFTIMKRIPLYSFSAPFRFVEAVAHTASFSHIELSSLPTVELWPLCMLGVTRCVLFGLVFSCKEKQATMISTSFLC